MATSNDIAANLQTELILDPNHPGIHDPAYVARRTFLFNLGREYRLADKGMPFVEYTEEEHQIWRHISEKLAVGHEKRACRLYLTGKHQLHIESDRIPDLRKLNDQLTRWNGFKLVAAEGLLDARLFFRYLSNRVMPCTQYIRYGSNPEYTPEPDAVHDIIGHIPALMDEEYVDLISLVGHGVNQATDSEISAWEKLYWFTIEFGLIEEGNELKAFGAGHFSSYEELEYAFSDHIQLRPFSLDEIIETSYDPTKLQDILFVIPSIKVLRDAVEKFIKR